MVTIREESDRQAMEKRQMEDEWYAIRQKVMMVDPQELAERQKVIAEQQKAIADRELAKRPVLAERQMTSGLVLIIGGIFIFVISAATGIFVGGASPAGGAFWGSSGLAQMKGAGALGAGALTFICIVTGAKLLWRGIKKD